MLRGLNVFGGSLRNDIHNIGYVEMKSVPNNSLAFETLLTPKWRSVLFCVTLQLLLVLMYTWQFKQLLMER